MLLSGHMIIKNGVKFDYPFIESALSVLPICDEFIFVEGQGEDGTYEALRELQKAHPEKIKIYRKEWAHEHYEVLSEMTNYAIERCRAKYHFQVQADEALHEQYHPIILESLKQNFDLAFLNVLHFYSNFHTVYKAGVYYDSFVRIARREKYPDICSYSDAMTLGCPVANHSNFIRRNINATVYHYGYVRKPRALLEKQKLMTKWWGYQELDTYLADGEVAGHLDWSQKHSPDKLTSFTETHPAVFKQWIADRSETVESGLL